MSYKGSLGDPTTLTLTKILIQLLMIINTIRNLINVAAEPMKPLSILKRPTRRKE